MKTSICILTKHSRSYTQEILKKILQQTEQDFEVNIIDSSGLQNASEKFKIDPRIRTHYISPNDFGHGKTRNLAVKLSQGEFITFLVDDAIPLTDKWLEEILSPLADPNVAGVCGKQIARDSSPLSEKYFYQLNFPDCSIIRKKDGEITHGDIFFSDANSCIRKSASLQFPFEENIIMCEDQKFAYDVLEAGYSTVYAPNASVLHSHAYSLTNTFKRYFDSAYAFKKILHTGFGNLQLKTGYNLLKELVHVARREPLIIPCTILNMIARISGTLLGQHADYLPKFINKKLSLHSYHWK